MSTSKQVGWWKKNEQVSWWKKECGVAPAAGVTKTCWRAGGDRSAKKRLVRSLMLPWRSSYLVNDEEVPRRLVRLGLKWAIGVATGTCANSYNLRVCARALI